MCVLFKCCVVRTGALKRGMIMREREMLKMDFRIVFFELLQLLLLLLLLFLKD